MHQTENLMNRAFAVLAACCLIGTSAQAAEYRLEKLPDDLAKLPCDAFVKTEDGAWMVPGTIILPNNTITDLAFKGNRMALIVDDHCGTRK